MVKTSLAGQRETHKLFEPAQVVHAPRLDAGRYSEGEHGSLPPETGDRAFAAFSPVEDERALSWGVGMIDRALEVVANRLNQHFRGRERTDEDMVVVTNVVDANGQPTQLIDDKLALFIVNIEKDTTSRLPAPRYTMGDRFAMQREPVRLNMQVMLAAGYTDGNYLQALKHLSNAVRYLQAHALFDHRNAPEMDESLERVVLEIHNLSTQELSHLWGVLGGRYLPSVMYTMRTISIAPDAIADEADPVRGTAVAVE